eukprot:m.344610 g.344610  ORF g.344610 m.344610 type:complete len:132 (+) comp20645_c0_seq21:259-654(+)
MPASVAATPDARSGHASNPGGSAGSQASQHELLLAGDTYATQEHTLSSQEALSVERAGMLLLDHVNVGKTRPVSQLLKIPFVKEVATVYFFVNMLRYAVYMWLPIYLHTKLGYSKVSALIRVERLCSSKVV